MSRSEWEQGSITLPASEVTPMKKALRELNNALVDAVYAEAKTLYKQAGTASVKKFSEFLSPKIFAEYDRRSKGYGFRSPTIDYLRQTTVRAMALHILEGKVRGNYRDTPTRISSPTLADLAAHGLKKMTNKDNTFPVFSIDGCREAEITFNGRVVTWDVPEGNHAVSDAHEGVVAALFFARLDRVTWTRGTGGSFIGNDEYNQDSRSNGGGANYITRTFGPAGRDARVNDYMRSGFSRKEAERFAGV